MRKQRENSGCMITSQSAHSFLNAHYKIDNHVEKDASVVNLQNNLSTNDEGLYIHSTLVSLPQEQISSTFCFAGSSMMYHPVHRVVSSEKNIQLSCLF